MLTAIYTRTCMFRLKPSGSEYTMTCNMYMNMQQSVSFTNKHIILHVVHVRHITFGLSLPVLAASSFSDMSSGSEFPSTAILSSFSDVGGLLLSFSFFPWWGFFLIWTCMLWPCSSSLALLLLTSSFCVQINPGLSENFELHGHLFCGHGLYKIK